MSLYWVTSFTPPMYKATAKFLIDSFRRHKVDGELLVFHEGFGCSGKLPFLQGDRFGVRAFSIDRSEMVSKVVEENKDIIPKALGGTFNGCQCPGRPSKFAKHRPRCPAYWFNRNATRWFRKFVALSHALDVCKLEDTFVWLDCDCVFKRHVPHQIVMNEWFKGTAVFYLQSQRAWPETGIVGYDLCRGGSKFIKLVTNRYLSGRFRDDERWDDCWQIMMTLRENPGITRRDVGGHGRSVKGAGPVVPFSLCAPYLDHNKGTHKRKRILT